MNRLKELRQQKKWQQVKLAEILNTTQQTIARYENGEREPDISTLRRLCDVFNCSADYLLGRSPLMRMELTPEEESLILAHRKADNRTRELVRLALEPWTEIPQKEKTAG